MSDSEDEDLKKAIALSLEEIEQPVKRRAQVIDLCSDDEGDDLAPLMSKHSVPAAPTLQACVPKPKQPEATKQSGSQIVDLMEDKEMEGRNAVAEPPVPVLNKAPPPSTGIFGMLNRKQMEEERIARARKRLQEMEAADPDTSQNSSKRKATSPPADSLHREGRQVFPKPSYFLSSLVSPKSRNIDLDNPSESRSPHRKPVETADRKDSTRMPRQEKDYQQTSSKGKNVEKLPEVMSYRTQQSNSTGIQYPDGVIKKTWAYGYPRRGDDIKIEEVLQKGTLDFAVLSSFTIDPDWIRSKLQDKTKVVWVLQAKTEAEKANYQSDAPDNYRFCFPSMRGNVNCMHSKLQLLAHSTHLRIVVPSANLVPYDWGEAGGIMENVCFLIDLPRYPQRREEDPRTFFATELIHFLNAMGLQQGMIDSLRKFDFSRTERLAFVHSIGGSHSGSNSKRTGYAGLGRAVQKLGLESEVVLSVDMVASSIGSLNLNFIKAMFLALQGNDGMTEYEWRINKPKNKNHGESAAEHKLSDDLKKHFRFYFPSKETVANSKGGLGAGGTICIQPQYYNKEDFPRALMRDCKSSLRPGILMHSKMIFVRPHRPTRNGAKAWAYIGSGNLSEAAWGRIVKDPTTKAPKINCRNWECGVIFAIPSDATESKGSDEHEGPPAMSIFKDHIPLPMVVPGEEYAGREPWYFNRK